MMLSYKALYLTSQFPIPGAYSSAFTLQRIKILQKLGVDIVVACPINKTPPLKFALNIKNIFKWVLEQTAIPDQAEVNGTLVYYVKRFQIPQPLLGWYSHLFLYWQTLDEFKKIISQVKPDIIISTWLPSSVVACKLGEFFDIPVIVLAEGSDVNFLPVKLRYWEAAQRILNLGAAAQVFVSNKLKEQAVKIGLNSKKMIVIYNGTDEEVFSINKNTSKSNTKNILAVGRLESVKGFQFLIQAFYIISKEYDKPVCLTIVGDGSLKSALLEQVRRGNLDELVNFVPSMHQLELANYYQQADVLCVSSLQESFGCVIVEAMACGTPVVASHVGGIVEIVDPTCGILVPPENPQALAQALMHALEKNWDSDLIRERVIENFTWGHTGKAFLNLIQEIKDEKQQFKKGEYEK